MFKFIKRVAVAAYNGVKNFLSDCVHHTEAAVLLVASSLGINALLTEVPMMYALPMFFEATMVIPVLSVVITLLLIKSAEWRSLRRNPELAYL